MWGGLVAMCGVAWWPCVRWLGGHVCGSWPVKLGWLVAGELVWLVAEFEWLVASKLEWLVAGELEWLVAGKL